MAKKNQKRSARSEKNNAGCMSGLISIFDFRQGHSTQRLLSDRRHGSARHGAAGSGYSKGKNNLSTTSKDKPKNFNDVDNIERRVDLGTSVKILMEEEMSSMQQPVRSAKIDTEQIRPNVGNEKNHRKANENLLSHDLHLNDKSSTTVPDKANNLRKTERFSYNLHLAALLEEFCGDRHQCQRLLMNLKSIIDSSPSKKSIGEVPCDFLDQLVAQVVQDQSTLHKVLIEIAEAIINQKGKALPSEASHQPEELVKVLEMLNSKELLLKLLQDQHSHFVKCIQENDQEGKSSKSESCKLFKEQDVTSRQCEEPVSHKMFQKQSIHKFFRKKDKLQEAKVSNGNDDAQPSNKIVILKPTPPTIQNSLNAVSPNTSQSHDSLGAEAGKERVASHFSLKEIRRRLKHVIGDGGKGHHILSMEGVLHRIPYKTGDSASTLKDGGQTKSESKICHLKEQAPQQSSRSKEKDKELNMKETQSGITLEVAFQDKNLGTATTASLHREHTFQQKARKHLVEMLNIVDGEANLPAMQTSKPLGRILSLSQYSFLSPRLSPGREKETSLSPRHTRFSPVWQLKEEDGKHLSPMRESIKDSPCIGTSRTLDQVCDSTPTMQRQESTSSGEVSRQKNLTSGVTSSPKGRTEDVEPLENEHVEERDLLNVPSKLNVGGLTDVAERKEEERSSLSPRANSLEMSQTITLLVPNTPATLLINNVGSPDSIIEKQERPSPVSVLEPLFTEDVRSPVNGADARDNFQAQPCHIHFEEHENSALVLTTSCDASNLKTCLEDKESSFEYVRAILEASGLIQDTLSERWHSSSTLLSQSLYDEVEYTSDEFPDDLRHLFDSINEVLEVFRNNFFGCTPWVSFAKPSIRPIPSGENLIKEVWKGVDQHFLSRSPKTLDQIVGKDMEVGTWTDLPSEIEGIGNNIGDMILDDMMEEILLEPWD